MILVTGATGMNGIELIKQLSAANAPVRALVRNPAKAEAIKLPGVEIAQGDLSDPASLETALEGVDKVFLLVGNTADVVQLNQNMLVAAKKAGVAQLVRFSVYGAAPDAKVKFLRDAWEIDQQLAASGLNYTILRPNAFYQNAFNSFAPTIASDNAFYIPMGDGKVSEVDVRDIAAVATAILIGNAATYSGKIYDITGPEALSFGDMAEIIGAVLGRKISYVNIPPEAYGESLRGYGVPGWLVDDLLALDEWYSQNGADTVTQVVAEVAGKEPVTYRQFIEDYRHIFK